MLRGAVSCPVFEEHIEIASPCALGSEKSLRKQPSSPSVLQELLGPEVGTFSLPWIGTYLLP